MREIQCAPCLAHMEAFQTGFELGLLNMMYRQKNCLTVLINYIWSFIPNFAVECGFQFLIGYVTLLKLSLKYQRVDIALSTKL